MHAQRTQSVVALTLTALVIAGGVHATSRFSAWSDALNLGPTVNSPFTDFGPALSPDGLSLYFSSDRPGGLGGLDLWVTWRTSVDDEWAEPVNLGPTINSSANEVAPNLSRDGHLLLFTSNRPGGAGGNDIWAATRPSPRDDFSWGAPVNLGPPVNGPGFDAGPHLRLPELYFASNRSAADLDIVVARLGPGGFGTPQLVTALNSPYDDARPVVRFDGLEIVYHSNRPEGVAGSFDIWTASRPSNAAGWAPPVNLAGDINTPFNEVQPFLSADGQALLFASDRPGGSGLLDLYEARRSIRAR